MGERSQRKRSSGRDAWSPAQARPTGGAAELTVLVAEGYPLLRYGLCRFLKARREVVALEEAADVAELLRRMRSASPHVLLLDFGLPGGNGLRTLAGIHQMFPAVAIVVLMAPGDEHNLADVLENGALGCLWKNAAPESLISAVHAVASGTRWVQREMAGCLIDELSRLRKVPPARKELKEVLTAREMEVLGLVVSGLRNAEVARRLFISEHTVRVHVSNLFHKLGLRDRIQLTHWAVRTGLVTAAGVSRAIPSLPLLSAKDSQ